MLITCFEDVDKLRSVVKDIHLDGPCNIVYDDLYFSKTYQIRDKMRNNNFEFDSEDDVDDIEIDD